MIRRRADKFNPRSHTERGNEGGRETYNDPKPNTPRGPMTLWKIAAVQTDCKLGHKAGDVANVLARLREAADHGARLVVFPECVVTGYCFDSKDEAWPHAEPIPGPTTDLLAGACRE